MGEVKKQDAAKLRSLRFSKEADDALRARLPHKGDMRARIVEAVEKCDLDGVVTAGSRHVAPTGRGFYSTSAAIPDDVWDKVRSVAERKKVSISLLVDRAVVSYWKDRNGEDAAC